MCIYTLYEFVTLLFNQNSTEIKFSDSLNLTKFNKQELDNSNTLQKLHIEHHHHHHHHHTKASPGCGAITGPSAAATMAGARWCSYYLAGKLGIFSRKSCSITDSRWATFKWACDSSGRRVRAAKKCCRSCNERMLLEVSSSSPAGKFDGDSLSLNWNKNRGFKHYFSLFSFNCDILKRSE